MSLSQLLNLGTVAQEVNGKTILITGGTGSFGRQIIKTLLTFNVKRVIIFSRDEKKQYDMRDEYYHEPRLNFVIGDVREYYSLVDALTGVDIVYHAAALKQVPSCQFYPMEAVRTNVLGAENVRRAAIAAGVKCVVAISTDKAVKPVNVMGMTKAISERVFLNPVSDVCQTRFVGVRYGNVVGSRGSVIPLFRSRIEQKRPLPITHPAMTRFLLTLPEAIDLVLFATVSGKAHHMYVRKMPATTIVQLAQVMGQALTGQDEYPVEVIGVRPGEKLHETLVSEEEMIRANEHASYFEIMPELTVSVERNIAEYRSDNTELLNAKQILDLLTSEGWFVHGKAI